MKNLKKVLAGVLSALILSGMAVMPAMAAPTGAMVVDFDDMGGVVTDSGIKNNSVRIDQYADKDATVPLWEVVKDPNAETEDDKALAYNTESITGTAKFWNYGAVDGKVLVRDFNVMSSEPIHNITMTFHTINQDESGTANFHVATIKSSANGYVPYTNYFKTALEEVKSNTWTNYKIIVDGTADSYGEYVVSFYVNGAVIYSKTIDEMIKEGVYKAGSKGTPYGLSHFMVVINNQDKETKPVIYFDDWKQYEAAEVSEFDMTDYSNYAVEYGKKLRFKTETYVGADNYYMPVDKVEYYDNGVKVGESNVAPYEFYYAPSGAGSHTITAKGYITELNSSEPTFTDSTTVLVEPQYRETVLVSEGFDNYVDGTTTWYDEENIYKWVIAATTADDPARGVTVDTVHGKSLSLGTTGNGRNITLQNKFDEGTIKVSGEYYFNSTGNNNTMFIFNNGSYDINSLRVHSGMRLLDVENANTDVQTLIPKRWYKFDLITTFKDGQGYYNLYVDGKRVAQSPYNITRNDITSTSLTHTNKIVFLSSWNDTAEIFIDNLSVSQIEYFDDTGFYCNDTEVKSIAEMAGTVLTAKTSCPNGNENVQYMAIYDKTTNELKMITEGTYDARTMTCSASCDLTGLENVYAKVFLWNDLMPTCSVVDIQ